MSWIVLTAADLNAYLVADQVEAIRTAALGAGQTDRFTEVMPFVVARVRSQIQARMQSVDLVANSVPPSLKTDVCMLVIEAIQAGIPGLSLTEDQKQLIRKAEDHLKSVASGDLFVEKPDNAAAIQIQQGGRKPIVTAGTGSFEDQDGL
jgi:hypothetical protein